MKRVIALFLACCLIVSALSVSVFAADDSIVGKQWSCSTTGKSTSGAGFGSGSGSVHPLVVDSVSADMTLRFKYGDLVRVVADKTSYDISIGVSSSGAPSFFVNGTRRYSYADSVLSDLRFDVRVIDNGSYSNLHLLMSNGASISSSAIGSQIHSFTMTLNPDDVSSSDSLSYVFDSSLSMNGFGSSPIEAIYDSFPGWSSLSRNVSDLYEIPAGTSIYVDLTVSVSGFSGFGSSPPTATLSMSPVDYRGDACGSGWTSAAVSPTIDSSNYLYSFSTVFKLPSTAKVYSADLMYNFTLTGTDSQPLAGNTLTCTVSRSSIFIKTLGTVSTDSEDKTNKTLDNIYNTVISNNTEVINNITAIIGVLDKLFNNTVTINAYLDSLIGEINAMGDDLDSVIQYLQNIHNQLVHISQVVDEISAKLDISNGWFEQFAGHLVQIKTDVGFCSTYLQGIYNTLSKFVISDTAAMREYLNQSNTNILKILQELQALRESLGDAVGDQLDEIIKNLVSQGTSLNEILDFLAVIKSNSAESVKLLQDILDELRKVEAENEETNDRLKAIQDALKDFEINVSKSVDNVLSSDDKKGLGGLISKLIGQLLSVVDFVGDLFGSVFTSIPSTISAYNDCNTFWGDQKTYVFTPHQVNGYTQQGGASYENSNASVQALFTEAEKYLGYPYVFGGSSPETSFDCSGFVCYALNHSGVYSVGRITAQGLYDSCTVVNRLDAKPGDLVFFTATYNCADTVSHVGIYAGNGRMLHCGDPIQYESIDTSYWQAHFYAFGRLPYNS